MFSTTVSKFILSSSFLLLLVFLAPSNFAHGQVVKTYSTGDLFGKKKKKQKAPQDNSPQIHAGTCLSAETNGTKLYQDLYRAEGHLVNIVSNQGIFPNAMAQLSSSLSDARYRFKTDAPIGTEIDSLHGIYMTCHDKGYSTLKSNVMDWLLGTQDAYSKLISSTVTELEGSVLRARKLMGMEGGIFADEVGDSNPSAAKKEIALGRKALASLSSVCKEFPGLMEIHQSELDGIESQYQEVEQAIGQEKEGRYVNAYHKDHLNTFAFGKNAITAATTSAQLQTTFTPQDDLFAALFLEKPMREFINTEGRMTLPSFYLEFSIGGQAIAKMKINSRPDVFLPFRILGQDLAAHRESGLLAPSERKKLMETLARLTPRKHPIDLNLLVGSKSLAKGQFNLDCTVGDHKAHYEQMLADLSEGDLETRRARYWEYLSYKHSFPGSKTRSTIEKNLMAAGQGKIKRAKVFIGKNRWTATVNEGGTVLYRRLYFEYIIEGIDGKFYAGENLVAEQALLGGGFETDLHPAFSPLDSKSGTLKDLWEKNNGEFILWQVNIKPEMVAPHWD